MGQLPRRSRYYHGCIDLDLLMKGVPYKELEVEFMTLNMKYAEYLEEGRERGFESGHREGHKEGHKEGIHSINRLNSYLLKNNMHDELERSISDFGYQKELLQKYHDQLEVADATMAYR